MQIDISDNPKTKKNNRKSKNNRTIIPPRSTKLVELTMPTHGIFLCKKAEIGPGIFVANSVGVSDEQSGVIQVAVTNTNSSQQNVKLNN